MFAATPAAALTHAASVHAQSAAAPMTRVRNINHVHFDVSDLQRSADFYGALLGARVHEKGPNFWTMTLPTGTPGLASWLSLTKAPQPEVGLDGSGLEPGHYSHMGIGIDYSRCRSDRTACLLRSTRSIRSRRRGLQARGTSRANILAAGRSTSRTLTAWSCSSLDRMTTATLPIQ